MDISELFTKDSKVKGTSSHTLKLEKPGCIIDSRKLFFSHSVIGCWNSLDQEMMDSPSVSVFKVRLDTLRQTRVGFLCTNPLSPRPHRMTGSPVRPCKVRYIGHFAAKLNLINRLTPTVAILAELRI